MGVEEVYRCLVENHDFVVFQLDQQGIFTYISPAIEHFAAYKTEELIGRAFVQFIYPADLPEVQTRFRDAAAGQPGYTEFRALHKDNSILWIRASSRPRFDAERPAGVIGIMAN